MTTEKNAVYMVKRRIKPKRWGKQCYCCGSSTVSLLGSSNTGKLLLTVVYVGAVLW